MKTFTAREAHDKPSELWQTAFKDGKVKVNHGDYRNHQFIITCVDREEERKKSIGEE